MRNNPYVFVFKTGDAELRALENLSIEKRHIFPIIELTRGKRSKLEKVGLISKRLNKIEAIFRDQEICLDITASEALANEEIDALYSFQNGYQNWIRFLLTLKAKQVFKTIAPTILVNSDDTNFQENLRAQVEELSNHFDTIVYRNSLADDACYGDIELIRDIIVKKNIRFYFIVDCEYIAPGAWKSFAQKGIIRVSKIESILKKTKFIILATSFPNNISDLGQDAGDTFRLNEIDLFNDIKSKPSSCEIIYGDYASINPIRNDEVIMSRGWVPRIDVALPDSIFYYRERRGIRDYSSTYRAVARKTQADPRFPRRLSSNWGVKQISSCAGGNAPGSSPSFWISVRMNMHIEQQVKRITDGK